MATVEPVVTDQPEQNQDAMATNGTPATIPTDDGWISGLCDCFSDISSCCLGTWCIPILGCLVSKKMNECCCAGIIGAAALRTKYRKEHKIKGTACNDCVSCCFCSQCVICQLARDLKKRPATT